MNDLLKLAERVEAATGADRELDRECHLAADYRLELPSQPARYPDVGRWVRPDGIATGWLDVPSHEYPPHYTASLDSAMALVPEGLRLMLSAWDDEKHLRARGPWQAVLSKPGADASFDLMRGYRCEHAATPALALTAAALKARASLQEEGKP